MKYRFALCNENHEEFAGGRVLYGGPGSSAFPVRLASETFQRCGSRLAHQGAPPPYTLYDPCCGEGYLLAVVGFLHGAHLARIIASDIDPEAVERTRRNLSLLTATGLDRRLHEIRRLIDAYHKPSHLAALESVASLRSRLSPAHEAIAIECFVFDIAADAPLPRAVNDVDVVFSDLPYGRSSAWRGAAEPASAARKLLAVVSVALSPAAVVALVANRQQAVSHPDFRRVDSLAIGRRRVTLLERAHRSAQAAVPPPPVGKGDTDR
jgi:SAM-dependent methyltransferase